MVKRYQLVKFIDSILTNDHMSSSDIADSLLENYIMIHRHDEPEQSLSSSAHTQVRESRIKKWAFKKTPSNIECWEYIDDINIARSYWYVAQAIDKYGADEVMPILMNDCGGYHTAPMDKIVAIVESEEKPDLEFRNKYQKIIDNPNFKCGWISPSGHTYSCSYMGHASLAEDICKMFGYPIRSQGVYVPDDTLLDLGYVKILSDGTHCCLWDKVNDKVMEIVDELDQRKK